MELGSTGTCTLLCARAGKVSIPLGERLYTFYPRVGHSPLATLQIRRGSVESVLSTLKDRGAGGKGHHRLKLICDRRLGHQPGRAAPWAAHETGAYAGTYAAAEHLGDTTHGQPFPYPTIDEARRLSAADPVPHGIAPRSLRRPT